MHKHQKESKLFKWSLNKSKQSNNNNRLNYMDGSKRFDTGMEQSGQITWINKMVLSS